MGRANHKGSGDGSPPAGSRGGAPVEGLGTKLKNFQSKLSYKQILRIFGSISHIFTYAYVFRAHLAGIILLSLRNRGIDTVCPPPLVCK